MPALAGPRVAAAACIAVAACLAVGASAQAAAQPAAGSTKLLTRQLDKALASSGPDVGLLVQDLSSGSVLYARNPAVPRPPASVEKLYTTVAALNLLGPGARLRTSVFGTGRLERGGVWHGNLYLRGGGDPTFGDGSWNSRYEDGDGPTALELVKQLRRDGIRRVTGHLWADESLFDSDRGGPATHNAPDTPDYGGEMSALVYDHGMSSGRMTPAVFAAHELALTLRSMGVRIAAAGRSRRTPSHGTQLAQVLSPPLSVLVRLMDVPSDDLIADMLAKQLGARLLGSGTLTAGAEEISQALSASYRLHPTIYDGSGLDRADQTTPAQVVGLLRKVWNTPTGALLHAALPVVGRQGTVQGIGVHTPAEGRCVAKTGTLDGVTNLAGYCHSRGGATLAFALFVDGPSNYESIPVLSRVVGAVARY